MTGQIITAVLAIAAVLTAAGCVILYGHDLTRLPRLLAEWRLAEATRKISGQDMEALADATREPRPEMWAAGCGCRWEMARAAGRDPAWVPCDEHADRLLRMVRGDGEER